MKNVYFITETSVKGKRLFRDDADNVLYGNAAFISTQNF